MPTIRRSQFRALRALMHRCPTTPDELHRFLRQTLSVHVPRTPLIEGNHAPFDYLVHTFFEPAPGAPGEDIIVWAARGAGKTYLGAVATLLDLLFKPGIQIRILGGSIQQSARMHAYLKRLLDPPRMRVFLLGESSFRRTELINGSVVELLAQSETSVRGTRVHKLRCDEVELFERPIWQAAQLVTRSGYCGNQFVRGTVEAISTAHRAGGLMEELIQKAGGSTESREPTARRSSPPEEKTGDSLSRGSPPIRLLKWSALDVIERCPPERACAGCKLEPDCQGRAKHADGFVSVDDLVAQRWRTSDPTWNAEMLCRGATRERSVYHLDDRHIGGVGVGGGESQLVAGVRFAHADRFDAREDQIAPNRHESYWVAGMDFGIDSPFVMLWARVLPGESDDPIDRSIEVVDEYVERGLTLDANLRRVKLRGWPTPEWVACDPAGGARNSHTGVGDIELVRRAGFRVRTQRVTIAPGIERVRRRLDHGLLRIDPRCASLIKGMTEYHFADDPRKAGRDPNPVKDGPDHVCDALRYLVVNLEMTPGPAKRRRYE